MSSQLHGIDKYIKTLEAIAQECGEKIAKDLEPKDEFLRTKQRLYELLEQVRSDLRDRQLLLKKRGNCYESIQKGHRVRQGLDELRRSLPKLQELHKRAQGKRNAKTSKEELQARFQDIRMLKKHVDEVQELFNGLAAGDSSGPEVSLLGLRDTARVLAPASGEDARRALTSEEEEALAGMRRRDAELDKQVGEIGSVVERLDPLARQIGVTAERQRLRAEAMQSDVEKAEQDVEQLNKRITEVMKYQRNTNFCCQLVLIVALLCCVGVVYQQVKG